MGWPSTFVKCGKQFDCEADARWCVERMRLDAVRTQEPLNAHLQDTSWETFAAWEEIGSRGAVVAAAVVAAAAAAPTAASAAHIGPEVGPSGSEPSESGPHRSSQKK